MELVSSKPFVMWKLVVCIAMLVLSPALAEETQETSSAVKPDNILDCIKSLGSVGGCIDAIKELISHNNFANLGKECCEALTNLGDNCWPIIFPDEPTVPILVKTVCAFVGAKEAKKAN
ncbi:hypothetical protein SLE2022_133900 [Rubroshorea leprosula]|uniref:Prolamin-like domain-containing protein n=1 Tax=Rubroshorea leprosula TaxID=152421 RepID=A0AAV5M6T6_9ROSI|nr:hypothetical protein SLEP1_g52277 [Rubroshorea leprosula]